ncbi:MAG: mechanosensitive ion channel family protein [Deltaproteobacteria bacterium]|nr:MAG: mechanosensitive ion channel family protein [Deltaproteobacteria bacterium]
MVAGLGIGGAAFALAAKDTVANLFGAIVIFVDRPFQVGDWVEIGSTEGTVEEIGLRVTQIRTFLNSVITIPNAQLTTTPINNWSRMRKRRIKMTVGVTYGATPEQILEGKAAIERLIASDERFDQSFFLVNFHEFGASSLDYFIYCFTVTTDWKEHMQIREEFLLGIMREFRKIGLEFAFPSQSVYVEKLPDPPNAPKAMARSVPL